ncbi:MAG TPA: helix-turn-helix domain-containing protein [Vicinamibacterales bacterium]
MGIDSTLARHGSQDGTLKYPLRGERAGSREERAACPLYTAIAVIAGRWKPMIMQRLAAGPMGFGELQRAMPRVRAKVLREQLRQMAADGLVSREQLRPAVLGVRYRVTPYGRTLQPVFNELWRWGTSHLARRGARSGTLVRPPAPPRLDRSC